VKVHYDEGLANHIGLEPCVFAREGNDEASAGERVGQPLSRERRLTRVPTPYPERKATWTGAKSLGPDNSAWSENLACAYAPWTGTGRSHVWPVAQFALARIGKARSRSR
jgi:hypothetical protein